MSVDPDSLKQTFGTIAGVYDAVRPGYPRELLEKVLSFFRFPQEISALEVGYGSGQATTLFAPSGMNIAAIDISAELITLARKRLTDYPKVRFEVSAFETFAANRTFDLIYSAQAFHWIPTAVGLPHAAHLLNPGGYLALFWNFINYDANEELVRIRESIIRHIPLFARYPEGSAFQFESFKTQWLDEIERTDLFKNIQSDIIETDCSYTLDEFLALVSSYSWFRSQPETIQIDLMKDLRDSFDTILPPFPVRTLLIASQRTHIAN